MAETTEKHVRADMRRQLKTALTEIQGLRDEIRVKIHLAGMDARDAWTKLEPRIYELEERAGKAAEVTVSELREVAADLKKHLTKIRDEVARS